MKHKFTFLMLMIVLSICGWIVRFWNLSTGFDGSGLPITGHSSIYALAAVSIASILVFLLQSIMSPGRSRMRETLRYSPVHRGLACAGAGLLLLGGFTEFLSQDTTSGLISSVLLIGAAVGFLVAALRFRSFPTVSPVPEILAVVCLTLRLIICFKGWSTDPIISDYCIRLFQSIFVLITVYQTTAFQFDLGKPRKTLFFTAGAFYFSGALLADGFWLQELGTLISCFGFLLWFLPSACCLLNPREPVPLPEQPKDK